MAEYVEREALENVAAAINKLIFDLRTNMTSVSRYVRDSREKHPTLTEGQFVDRNLEYKRLAEQAVDNILSCLDSNEYLRRAEGLEALARQTKPTTADKTDHEGEGTAPEKEKKMVPMYLGNCDEGDCEHWSWCGDSYGDRNTECFCRVNGARVYRDKADEERILCPLGKMMEDENDDG